jgi:hypothetical protein
VIVIEIDIEIVSNRIKSYQKWHTSFFVYFFNTRDRTHTMSVVNEVSEHLEGGGSEAIETVVDGNMTCPITMELFVDPVLCIGDGQTYERSAILRHLQTNTTSPITNLEMQSTEIVPNYQARRVADSLRDGPDPEDRVNDIQLAQPGAVDREQHDLDEFVENHFFPQNRHGGAHEGRDTQVVAPRVTLEDFSEDDLANHPRPSHRYEEERAPLAAAHEQRLVDAERRRLSELAEAARGRRRAEALKRAERAHEKRLVTERRRKALDKQDCVVM